MHTNEIAGDWWTIPAERAKNGKTQRVYNRHGYDKEKQQALEAWEHRLEFILGGSKGAKVIPLVRRSPTED